MFSVNVERMKLIQILEKNRVRHVKVYKEAFKMAKKNFMVELRQISNNAKKGKFTRCISIEIPQSQEKSYKDQINMLKISCDKQITLDEHNHSRYVLDRWSWTSSFVGSVFSNVSSSSSSSSSDGATSSTGGPIVSSTTTSYLEEMRDEY